MKGLSLTYNKEVSSGSIDIENGAVAIATTAFVSETSNPLGAGRTRLEEKVCQK